MLDGETTCDGADDNGEKDTSICQHNGPMAVLVREQFGKGKSSQLGVSSTLP